MEEPAVQRPGAVSPCRRRRGGRAELARTVREATRDLPFGCEPAVFPRSPGAAPGRRVVSAAELLSWGLADLAARIRAGDVSSREATDSGAGGARRTRPGLERGGAARARGGTGGGRPGRCHPGSTVRRWVPCMACRWRTRTCSTGPALAECGSLIAREPTDGHGDVSPAWTPPVRSTSDGSTWSSTRWASPATTRTPAIRKTPGTAPDHRRVQQRWGGAWRPA